jgi:hypothetical protein
MMTVWASDVARSEQRGQEQPVDRPETAGAAVSSPVDPADEDLSAEQTRHGIVPGNPILIAAQHEGEIPQE